MISLSETTIKSELKELIDRNLRTGKLTDKCQTIFNAFVSYISNHNFRYNLNSNSLLDTFLDSNPDSFLSVNCTVLSMALMRVFKIYGISEAVLLPYASWGETRLKFSITEPMRCFDKIEDANFKRKGYAIFSNHYVVQVGERLFDPTFCYIYSSKSQPYRIVPVSEYIRDVPVRVDLSLVDQDRSVRDDPTGYLW